MDATITIYCKNTHTYNEVPRGISLIELKDLLHIQLPYPIIAAHVNYKVENLDFRLYKPKDVEFLDASTPSGMRAYVRTLGMVLACAVNELYPKMDLRVEHPISKGYYCTLQWHIAKDEDLENKKEPPVITPEIVKAIKARMQSIISENRPIYEEEKQTKEVIHMFAERYNNESSIFETLGNPYCRYFRMGDFIDYYTNVLLPSSGYINVFDLVPFKDGLLLRIPNRQNPTILEDEIPQEKMFSIFQEYNRWNKLLHINNVNDFNIACKDKKSFDWEAAKAKLQEEAKRTDIYYRYREWPYKHVARKVFAEKYLGDNLTDYKFYCFDGDADCVLVCTDRQKGKIKYYFLDQNWHLLPYNSDSKNAPDSKTEKELRLRYNKAMKQAVEMLDEVGE